MLELVGKAPKSKENKGLPPKWHMRHRAAKRG